MIPYAVSAVGDLARNLRDSPATRTSPEFTRDAQTEVAGLPACSLIGEPTLSP